MVYLNMKTMHVQQVYDRFMTMKCVIIMKDFLNCNMNDLDKR